MRHMTMITLVNCLIKLIKFIDGHIFIPSGRYFYYFTQPMTEISGEKCKRCGIYEQDSLILDKEFDEWEALSFRLLC